MAFLTLLSIAEKMPDPSGFWQFFIFKVFDFVVHYGWRVIVFIVCLKLILSPLDIYQRFVMRKNERIKKRIQPDLDKLEAQYGNNRQLLQQKTMELNKREGFSYASTCVLAIIPLIIFITLFQGLNNISQYMYTKQYLEFYDIYHTKYEQVVEDSGLVVDKDAPTGYVLADPDNFDGLESEIDGYIQAILAGAVNTAQEEVKVQYEDNLKVDFFWIKNLWSPDVPWKKPILEHGEFINAIGKKYSQDASLIGAEASEFDDIMGNVMYNRVTLKLRDSADNKVNGWLILPILSVGLSFLSQFIMSKQQRNSGMSPTGGQGASTMKMMMFMMPLMMGFFALSYTSVFTLYIVANSLITLIINLSSTYILKGIDSYNENRARYVRSESKDKEETQVMRYGRPDPNAKKEDTSKNNKPKKK